MKRMMKLYLQDILDSINAIEEYTNNLSEEDFCSRTLVQDAVVRRLEIIGEAVKNLDEGVREQYPQIPWRNIAGLRDIIAHEYFGINIERIWEVTVNYLPELKAIVKAILEDVERDDI